MAFLRRETFTGNDAAECVTGIFASDRVLRHELDAEWKTGNTRRMSAKRALSHLRSFKDIDTRHTEHGSVYYQKTDDAPIVTLWKHALDKTPFSDGFFKKWFFEKTGFSGSETLVSVGKTPDTLINDSSNREQKTNVSGLQELHQYLAGELSDYAREQIAIHGNVF